MAAGSSVPELATTIIGVVITQVLINHTFTYEFPAKIKKITTIALFC